MELRFGGQGKEGIWLLSPTLNRWEQNRALPHPQPRCLNLGSGPGTQTMGSDGSFSGLAFPGQEASLGAGIAISSDSEKGFREREEETVLRKLLTGYPGKLGHSLWDPSPVALPSCPSVSARTII